MAGEDITPTSAWAAKIHVPSSGDPVLAADLKIAATALGNREQFLRDGIIPQVSTTHTCPLLAMPITPNSWTQALGNTWTDDQPSGSGISTGPLRINFLLPDGAIIDSISVYYTGASGSPHASDLSNITKPIFYGYAAKYDGTLLGPLWTVTDPSTSDSAYGTNHAITISPPLLGPGAPLVIDAASYAYYALLAPETGSGRKAGGKVTGVRFTYHFGSSASPRPSLG